MEHKMTKYNLIDFLNDIAFTLDKASNFTFNEGEAQEHACDIYQQFLEDEAQINPERAFGRIIFPKFGDDEYDWTPLGASILANEYSISYWDE